MSNACGASIFGTLVVEHHLRSSLMSSQMEDPKRGLSRGLSVLWGEGKGQVLKINFFKSVIFNFSGFSKVYKSIGRCSKCPIFGLMVDID